MSPKPPDLPLGLTTGDLYAVRAALRGREENTAVCGVSTVDPRACSEHGLKKLPVSCDEFGEWLAALADYYLGRQA